MRSNINLLRTIRNFRFRSLFFKSLLLIFFLVIIPFSAMTYVIYVQMDKAVQSETRSVSMSNLLRVRDVMDTIFFQMDHISLELINQEDVHHFLLKPDTNNFSSALYQNIYDKISMYTRTYAYVDSVYIYSDTNRYFISNRESTLLDNFKDQSWYSQVYSKIQHNRASVELRLRNDVYPYYISFTRPAYYFEKKIGAVTTNIDIEELRKLWYRSRFDNEDLLFIVNQRNQIMYSHQRDDFMLQAAEVPLLSGLDLTLQQQSDLQRINGQHYMVTMLTSGDEEQPFKYISLIPLNRYSEKIDQLNFFIVLFFGIGAVVLLAVSIVISLKSLSPVNQIMSLIHEQEKVEYAMEWTERKHLNELKYITHSIFQTIDAKRILQKELQLRQQLLHRAQTTALQTQINPHFLYNTLESIKYLAVALTKGQNAVSKTITELSDLLRYGLDSDNPLTTIRREIYHARSYLDIMQLRYPNRFVVEWHIDSDMLNNTIVKIALQPLLENALNHGILPQRKQGYIVVVSAAGDDHVDLLVQDNGAGIDPQHLHALNQSFHEKYNLDERHIGMKNVNQRIKLIYGEPFGLQVSCTETGTTVRMRLPRQNADAYARDTSTGQGG